MLHVSVAIYALFRLDVVVVLTGHYLYAPCPSGHPFVRPPVRPFVRPSVRPSVCLSEYRYMVCPNRALFFVFHFFTL
jgi:hypothetical protein